MLSWLSKKEASSEPTDEFDFSAVENAEVAVLFKHSPTCSISWYAEREVRRFAEAHPTIPVHTISIRNRELTREVAAKANVRHESPQVIIFRRGTVVAHTSHEGVTADYLEEATL